MNNITLHVNSVQKSMGEEPIEIDFITEGKLYQKNNAHHIIYEETEISGLAGHKTHLKIKETCVDMHRYGPSPTKMHFELGKRETAHYKTPYGEMKLEFLTHKLHAQIRDNAGDVYIEYALSIKGLKEATHILNIAYQHLPHND